MRNGKPLSEDLVRSTIESRGFKMLSSYVNVSTRLRLECPKGHLVMTSFQTFKTTKHGCMKCFQETRPRPFSKPKLTT